MNLAELKKQLAEGKITKEQFIAEVKKLLDAGTITQAEFDEATKDDDKDPDKKGFDINELLNNPEFQKLIQSQTDKVRTEYSQKLKKEQEEKERILKEKMTDEEKAKFESEKLKSELEQKQLELTKREVALHTVDQLKDKQLPLEFRDILAGESIEATDERIKTFESAWATALNKAVNERFKENGGEPGKGKGDKGDKNPWSKENFNLTEQGRIFKEDPEKARKLAAEVGLKLNY